MTIYETINNDITVAMKETDKFTLSVLRMLKSAMQLAKKNQADVLADDEVIVILRKQIKQRNESMLEFEKYGRNDLAEPLKKEIEVLTKYLPKELTEEELTSIIDEIFTDINPEGVKDMGKVMKLASEKIGTRADMGKVSAMIKERLI